MIGREGPSRRRKLSIAKGNCTRRSCRILCSYIEEGGGNFSRVSLFERLYELLTVALFYQRHSFVQVCWGVYVEERE